MRQFKKDTEQWVSAVSDFLGKIDRKSWATSFDQLIPKAVIPVFSYPIDQKRQNEYLNCFANQARKKARENYLNSTLHIPFETWHKQLCTSLKATLFKRNGKPKAKTKELYLWTQEQANKSQLWVAAQALRCSNSCGTSTCGQELRARVKGVFTNASRSRIIPRVAGDGKLVDRAVIFFDDMAYSGNQLSNDIKLVASHLEQKGWRGDKTHLIAVIPYIGSNGLAKLKAEVKHLILPGHTVKRKFIPQYKLVPVYPKKRKDELYKVGDNGGDYAVYFDHKIADKVSIFSQILRGDLPKQSDRTPGCQAQPGDTSYRIFTNCEYYPQDVVCPTPPYKKKLQGKL